MKKLLQYRDALDGCYIMWVNDDLNKNFPMLSKDLAKKYKYVAIM